jgi:hypothetical protein
MSNNGTNANGQSVSTFVEEVPGRSFLLSEFQRRQLVDPVVDESGAAMDRAVASLARVQQEIDRLWHESATTGNSALSARLLDVSHALRRAARLLEHGPTIG